MEGFKFFKDPWVLRVDQVYEFLKIWKADQRIRSLMDRNIVKMIAKYIKVDLSGSFKVSRDGKVGSAAFRHITFPNSNSNYWGWEMFINGREYRGVCPNTLRPSKRFKIFKDVTKYKDRFIF